MNDSLSKVIRDGSTYELAGKQLDQVSGGSADLAVRPVTYTGPTNTSASLARDYSGGRFAPARSQPESW